MEIKVILLSTLFMIFFLFGFFTCLITLKLFDKKLSKNNNIDSDNKIIEENNNEVENISKDLRDEWFFGIGGE